MATSWKVPRSITLFLLTTGFVAISYGLIATPPTSQRQVAEYVIPTVDVVPFKEGAVNVTIQAFGLITPAYQAASMSAQVPGKITAFHPAFKPGGVIPAGETIIHVDRSDYLLAIEEAKAKLARAEAAVTLEQGQQQIAKADFLQAGISSNSRDARSALALRQPQLNTVMAEQRIAQLNLDKAKLALKRTALTLPYDALMLETSSALGDVVSGGTTLAKLTRADTVWLELKVPQQQLVRLTARSGKKTGSLVTFQSHGHHYQGEVISIRGNLTATTRMGGVIVEVTNNLSANHDPDPLVSTLTQSPPLIIGSHIEATLQAGVISDVLKIPRKAMTDQQQIYVVDDMGKLQLRDLSIKWQMADALIIQGDIQSGDRLIVSRIAGIATGTPVHASPSNALAPESRQSLAAMNEERQPLRFTPQDPSLRSNQ